MASARQLALDVLPHFAEAVLCGNVLPYGYYAKAIGRSIAEDSIAIGHAMHAIGGVCVYAQIPVAPLYFVRRADRSWRGVFESDPLESERVLPHYDTLYASAKVYKYTSNDFTRVERGLREVVPNKWSPHFVWHFAVVNKPKGSDETYFQRALRNYVQIIEEAKANRAKTKKASLTARLRATLRRRFAPTLARLAANVRARHQPR